MAGAVADLQCLKPSVTDPEAELAIAQRQALGTLV